LHGRATVNNDFRDLVAAINARNRGVIVVGAHALAAHGHVRATNDLALWIRPDADNAARTAGALRD
jgi:hypothetical protein